MKIKLEEGAFAPTRAHDTDAGLDLYSRDDKIIPAGDSACFDTGVHIELPSGCCAMLVSKSGLNVRKDITSTGLIDEGYSGSIVVKLYNHGSKEIQIRKGDKISQLVVFPVRYEPVEIAEDIRAGERGDAGFGSTGR